ncbi:MAG: hypothetical protein KC910_05115 [Candidatus Eremiobacteraeota bacterium]|nr:hypothetical protein [Candidatus Eremiobacteraeota bacterium]
MGFRFSVLALMVALLANAASAEPRIQIRLDLGGNRGYQDQCPPGYSWCNQHNTYCNHGQANYGPPPGYYYCNQHGQYCNHGQSNYYQTNYNQGYYNQGYYNQGYSNRANCNTGYSNRGYSNYGHSRGRGHDKHNRGHGCRR